MKKIIFPIVLSAILFSGCDVYRTYETYEVIKQGTDMFVDYIDAYGADWKLSGKEGQPGCYVYQEFRFDAEGRDNILPYVFPVDNQSELIMQNIRFDVEKGILTLIIEWQDFRKYSQDNYRFKVCILKPGK